MQKNTAFTLLEILIAIALLILILTVMIVLLDPGQQIGRSRDAQRKHQLDTMKKVFEDFYNDRGCYPKPSDVCYTGTDNGSPVNKNPCFICGNEPTSPSFKPYLNSLPCDPSHPQKKYSYQVDSLTCPSWFKLYVNFDSKEDPDAISIGCGEGGCGGTSSYGYDWGVSSSNTTINKSPNFYCYTYSSTCDNCGQYQSCDTDSNCQKVFGTFALCCQHSPKPIGCP